jgi:serine/threonine protein kinase
MKYLHSFKPPIVHRDLRSPNVFVRAAATLLAHTLNMARVSASAFGLT